MRRLLTALTLLLALALLPATAQAQNVVCPNVFKVCGGGIFSGGTVTTPILFPDGTAALPAGAFANDPDTGFWRPGGNAYSISAGGTAISSTNSTGFIIASGRSFGWTNNSTDPNTTVDTILRREAAANVQLGDDVNGAAVDQTISCADAITGSDISGGDCTFASGTGMGTGAVSALIFQTPTVAAAGANPQSLATRLTINSSGLTAVGAIQTSGTIESTSGSLKAANGGAIFWGSRSSLTSPADSILAVTEADGVGFTRFDLGGVSDDFPGIAASATVSGKSQGISIVHADGVAPVFADLGAATNGSMIYCSDCTIANPCAGSGTGAIAKRLNGVWVCN